MECVCVCVCVCVCERERERDHLYKNLSKINPGKTVSFSLFHNTHTHTHIHSYIYIYIYIYIYVYIIMYIPNSSTLSSMSHMLTLLMLSV